RRTPSSRSCRRWTQTLLRSLPFCSFPLPRVATHVLLDRAEDRVAFGVAHLDPHAIAEFEVWRFRRAEANGLDGTLLGDAGIAQAALGDRQARIALGVTVRHGAGAENRTR